MDISITTALLIYKVFSLGSGTVVIYLGYSLFIKGIFSDSGDFEASYGKSKVLLRRAAPGTFFALFGTVIISTSLYQGLTLYSRNVPINIAQDIQRAGTDTVSAPDPKDISLIPPKFIE